MLSESAYGFAAGPQESGPRQLAKPRNKRKNFRPISSRMAEAEDEEERDEAPQPAAPMDLSTAPRPPSSDGEDDSADSFGQGFALGSPGTERHWTLRPGSPSSQSSAGSVEEGARPAQQEADFAESTMQELLAVYGLGGAELARSALLGAGPREACVHDATARPKEAPGSPPTPPHTPQSPCRQASSNGAPGHVQQAAAAAGALQPGLAGSALQQILAQNPALAQLLQQNPGVLGQQPQLAQLLQQNLRAQLGAAADDAEEARAAGFDLSRCLQMSPTTISSLAAIKVEAIEPKVSGLLESKPGASAASQQQQQQQQPPLDYSRYVRRFGSAHECGNPYCKEVGCREHFHCLDCMGRVFVKKEEMIRHFKWHKKRDESLAHGFMRYSPTDDCAERQPSRHCPHNRKQTHYHCIHDNCDKVYISTSDVQMHANYHRKDSAIIQEGFQRFRATESCATDYCPFAGQRTTHFHCRRAGCRYTFKNKADMDKHKSYHIKDEQLSRDGFKKFMKSEACPFEQCRFSRVCNHIHCIRPHCSYVLHSSGQLFSHKRKHERSDSEMAYRRYKHASDEATPSAAQLNGDSSSEACLSPDGSQQGAMDLAMDLSAAAPEQLSALEMAYLAPATADCACGLGQVHLHCGLERCGATLREAREAREHLHEHEAQERVSEAFFEEGGCEAGSCPYHGAERHYHCGWESCREVVLASDQPFRRLQHYRIHEYSRQLNLSQASRPLSSELTLTHLTNIEAMFRRKRGRPPKNRVVEIWPETEASSDSPQAVFTSFKLPRARPASPELEATAGFVSFGPEGCPEAGCRLRGLRHQHCSRPRCHFATERPEQLLLHSKDFHDNVRIAPGFAFFDRALDCGDAACPSNRLNRHFHCTRPSCGFSFVRYSAMAQHEQQHEQQQHQQQHQLQDEQQQQQQQLLQQQEQAERPRIHVKDPAELIEKAPTAREAEDSAVRTTVVRAAGTYYPITGPPSESALPGAMLSMRASVHQEAAQPAAAAAAAAAAQPAAVAVATQPAATSSTASGHTLYGPEQSCSRPFCKLKRKDHYHCGACNQAFSELDRLRSHAAKHSAAAASSPQTSHAPAEAQQEAQLDAPPVPEAPAGFELTPGFHFASPASVVAAMNQQMALMNLPPFLAQPAGFVPAPVYSFGGGGVGVGGFTEGPLACLAANLQLGKRALSPSEAGLSAAEAKKARLHHSMRMLKDEPVPEGYVRFRFNEDCRYPHCGYREHQTHFHCMRQDCGYSFCDKTRFVQHTARHERLDTLMGGDFQQYRANVPCGRAHCAYTSSLGAVQNKASHFHCLKCDFVCTDTNKVVAHRRQHAKLDSIAAAGFQKFTPSQPCGALHCQHSAKQTHYHCLQCQYAVLGLAQMSAHKYRHMDA